MRKHSYWSMQKNITLFLMFVFVFAPFMTFAKEHEGVVEPRQTTSHDGNYTREGARLVASPNELAAPNVKIFDRKGNQKKSLMAYASSIRNQMEIKEVSIPDEGKGAFITFMKKNAGSQIQVYDRDGNHKNTFFAYDKSYLGGINVYTADIDNDGRTELVTVPTNGAPHLKVFRWRNDKGYVLSGQVMVYGDSYRGGLNVAIANTDKDSDREILVLPDVDNAGANLRIFDWKKSEAKVVYKEHHFPFGPKFRGEVELLAIDLNGDSRDEVVMYPKWAAPDIKVYGWDGDDFVYLHHFFPYNVNYRGGLYVSKVDLNGTDSDYELLVLNLSGVPNIRVYDFDKKDSVFKFFDWFFPFGNTYQGGITIDVGNVDNDSGEEIVVAPASGGPNVRVFGKDDKEIKLEAWEFVYNKDFRGGVNVYVEDVDDEQREEIIVAPRKDGGPNVRILEIDTDEDDADDKIKLDEWFFAFDKAFKGGVKMNVLPK